MDEIKHMLEVIHEENKDIIALLECEDGDWRRNYRAMKKNADSHYDRLFYGEKRNDEK